MSVEALAIALHHSRASGVAKLVLLGIANHHGDGGAWPSIATLARYANASERTVQRAITDLVELGEISVETQAGGTWTTKPQYRTNRFEMALGCPPDCDRTTAHRTIQEPDPGVTPMSPLHGPGVTRMSPLGVTPMSPEPSLEPLPPQPPAATAAGGACRRHPEPRPNCRTCGTTPRQLAQTRQAEAAERRRARDRAAAIEAQRQREAFLATQPTPQELKLREAVRRALRGAAT